MARKVNQGLLESGEELGDRSTTMGGAPGVIADAIQTFPTPGVAASTAFREPAPDAHRIKTYIITNPGGVYVMYGGVRTQLRQNKILDENSYDLELLKRQGVQLKEV